VDDREGSRDYTQLALIAGLTLIVALVFLAVRCA
jgi:hypothetical protein